MRYIETFGALKVLEFDPKVSGENTTPIARKATAVRNRVNHAISFSLSLELDCVQIVQKEVDIDEEPRR